MDYGHGFDQHTSHTTSTTHKHRSKQHVQRQYLRACGHNCWKSIWRGNTWKWNYWWTETSSGPQIESAKGAHHSAAESKVKPTTNSFSSSNLLTCVSLQLLNLTGSVPFQYSFIKKDKNAFQTIPHYFAEFSVKVTSRTTTCLMVANLLYYLMLKAELRWVIHPCFVTNSSGIPADPQFQLLPQSTKPIQPAS